MFASENIRSILRKVSSWYNDDIVYQDKAPKKAIWGTVSKFDNVSEVLKVIELTGVAHFTIEGRKWLQHSWTIKLLLAIARVTLI
ncbi:DUF4974 domain-containing protein [Mucilaginibacter sp. AW1-7]|uniref:DUF4974 domain-containing protein n=1 Tax=Mucilaginibacter sp. AW1-7 TaxID=3349874 RepID=UPI003F731D63